MLKTKKNRIWLIFFITIIVILGLSFAGALRPVERIFVRVIKPVNTKLFQEGNKLNSAYLNQQEEERLVDSLSELEQEVARLSVALADYEELASENEKLRALLNFSKKQDYKTEYANIIAKEGIFSESSQRDLIIDKGARAGLKKGLAVLSEEGVVVGKIIDLDDETARVCLSTSPGCQFAASILNESQSQGLSDGRLGLTIEMSYIPQLEKIDRNDLVISSGLSEDIPRGLVLGKVSEIKSESNEVWQTAMIEPVINFNTLTLVSVILP